MSFKKGNIPWNKEKKCPYLKGNTNGFKKGMIPWNKNKHWSEGMRTKLSEAHKGKKPSKETRIKMSLSHKGMKKPWAGKFPHSGAKNPSWKGGITSLRRQIYNSSELKNWRHKIFERDNYTCCECHKVGGELHSHHIKSFSKILEEYKIKTIQDAIDCKELWNINNGVTLCKKCHKLTHRKNEYK